MNPETAFPHELSLVKRILDKLDQGCILLDSRYGIRHINAKARDTLKNTDCPQPQNGLSILYHCLTDSHDRLKELIRAIRIDTPFTWTRTFAHDTRLEYQFSLEIFNDGTDLSGFLLKMTDISVYASVEQQLNQSNDRYLLATRASYDMIWERDFSRDRYYFSEALHTIYGYDPATEWSWKDVVDKLIHPGDREKVIDFVSDCYRHKIQLFQCPAHRYIRKDGVIIWVDVRCFALYDATGQNTRTIGVTRDISREHYLQQNLRQQSARLEASNKELERFVYIASHDLQEPLRTISSLLSLLQKRYDPLLDENARQYIDISVTCAQRMQAMVKGLLDLAKIGAVEKTPVDMEELVQETLKDLAFVITEKNARITIRSPLPIIIAEKRQLYQVLLNLLGNAVKYTGTTQPVVEISCVEQDQSWQFSIMDNGIGIEQKYQEKIFGLFQRLHKQDEYSGTGIGLAVVKKIIEAGGGSIRVSSEPGNGCCFIFTVPKPPMEKRAN